MIINAICDTNFSFFVLPFRIFIGIKKLLALIDLLRQTEGDYRVAKFLSKLEEEDAIELRN